MNENNTLTWGKINKVICSRYGKSFDYFNEKEGTDIATKLEALGIFLGAFGGNPYGENLTDKEQIVNKVIEELFREVFVDKVPVDQAKENAVNRLRASGLK